MNNQKVAAALRLLAEAFETPAATADLQPASPPAEAAPPKRGRGRPVAGEAAQATTPAATTAQTPAPAATEPDPFDSPVAAAPVATLDEVRAALKALAASPGSSQAAALKVLKDVSGVDNLSELQKTPEKYGAVAAAAKAATPAPVVVPTEDDPFGETAAPAAPVAVAEPAPSLEDVKKVVVKTQGRTSTDAAQKVVMDHGGKAAGAGGAVGPSLKALPVANYAAVIAALNALPTTK